MKKYIEYLKQRDYSINTLYCYKSSLKKFLKEVDINDLDQIVTYIHKTSKAYGATSVNFIKTVIIGYLKFNKSKFVNIVQEIKVPKISNKMYKILSEKDFLKYCKHAKHNEQIIFKIFFYTGIRLCEINNLKTDFENNKIIIFGKGRKYREIPITKKIKDLKNIDIINFSRRKIYNLIHQYFPKWVTPHTFRRSFCTNLIKNGANIKIVSTLMGHTKLDTTSRYIHLDYKDIKKELDRYL